MGFNDFLNEEFAVLGPKEHTFGTDVKIHVMQPSDKKIQHGPRIKVYKDFNKGHFTVSISDNPRVIGEYREIVTTKELNSIIENVKKFKIPLLNYWYGDFNFLTSNLITQIKRINSGEMVHKIGNW